MRKVKVAILGAPNAGKSTLLNKIVGEKVSIVSKRAQTTRENTLGIMTSGDCQTEFSDTPGVERNIERQLLQQQLAASEVADVIIFVADARLSSKRILGQCLDSSDLIADKKFIVVLNKIDLVEKGRLLKHARCISEQLSCDIMFVSALSGDGIKDLSETVMASAHQGSWSFGAEDKTTSDIKKRLQESLREALLHLLGDEIPYQCKTIVDEVADRAGGRKFIRLSIMVAHPRHRGIIIGSGGEKLKSIRQYFVREAKRILGCNCRVAIEVKYVKT